VHCNECPKNPWMTKQMRDANEVAPCDSGVGLASACDYWWKPMQAQDPLYKLFSCRGCAQEPEYYIDPETQRAIAPVPCSTRKDGRTTCKPRAPAAAPNRPTQRR
jgi:hypothetical protein